MRIWRLCEPKRQRRDRQPNRFSKPSAKVSLGAWRAAVTEPALSHRMGEGRAAAAWARSFPTDANRKLTRADAWRRISPTAPGDGGGGAGGAGATGGRTVRGRDDRWGWTRGSHSDRQLAEWLVVRM